MKIIAGILLILISTICTLPVVFKKYPKTALILGFILLFLGTCLIFSP